MNTNERVKDSLKKMEATASLLNATTNDLSRSVAELERQVGKLNIGLAVWIPSVDPKIGGVVSKVGYAKIDGTWGFAASEQTNVWLFPHAPRLLRLRVAERIPDILEALLKAAVEFTAVVDEKQKFLDEVASAIDEYAKEREAKK